MPHHGINLATNGRGRNYIEHNRIEHVTLEIADTGAINSWMDDPCSPGEPSSEFVERAGHVIRHNLIKHVRGCIAYNGEVTDDQSARGIYLDDGTSNCIVTDNIVMDAHTGMQIHGGRHNLVENNLFIDTLSAVMFFNDPANRRGSGWTKQMLRGNRFTRNLLFSRREKHTMFYAPEEFHKTGMIFAVIQPACPLSDEIMDLCDDNVYHFTHSDGYRMDLETESGDGSQIERITLEDWQARYGHDLNSSLDDPMFGDVDSEDFSLPADSPAIQRGFKPIDVPTIGIRPE